jgi:benzoyl-CoA reductase subunit D
MTRLHTTAGIDPGASSVKVALVASRAGEAGEVLATAVERIRRRELAEVVEQTFAEACSAAGVGPEAFDYIASTGDGDAVPFRTGHFYSPTTHGRGAAFLAPEARAVLDVGALHGRALAIDHRGKVLTHRMTSQCASGSGQFLENIARYLGVPLPDVGPLSLQSQNPERCSSICAVLAETDVINMVSRGIATADILKGIHLSIAGRLVRLLRATGAAGVVLVTGGLARDPGLVAALQEALAEEEDKGRPTFEVRTHPDAILAGALGAALLGAYRHEQLERLGRRPGAVRPGAGDGEMTGVIPRGQDAW